MIQLIISNFNIEASVGLPSRIFPPLFAISPVSWLLDSSSASAETIKLGAIDTIYRFIGMLGLRCRWMMSCSTVLAGH